MAATCCSTNSGRGMSQPCLISHGGPAGSPAVVVVAALDVAVGAAVSVEGVSVAGPWGRAGGDPSSLGNALHAPAAATATTARIQGQRALIGTPRSGRARR